MKFPAFLSTAKHGVTAGMQKFRRAGKIWQIGIVGGAIVLVLGGGVAIAAVAHSANKSPQTARTSGQTKKEQAAQKDAAAATQTQVPATVPDSQAAGQTAAPKTAPAPASTNGTLVFSPSTITVTTTTVSSGHTTMTASDGSLLNYPLVASSSGSWFSTNAAAGPAKQSWNLSFIGKINPEPGTYTLTIRSQIPSKQFYSGSLTIVIIPSGNITADFYRASPVGGQTQHYAISLYRTGGYNRPVTSVSVNTNPSSISCGQPPLGNDFIPVQCSAPEGISSGTLTATIVTDYKTITVSAPFTTDDRQ